MKAYIKTHYEILAMNKEELAQVPPDVFMMYGTSLSSSLLGLFPKEKWNIFSYEQLMYMNQKVFNSLSSDVLHMLYQKFKNNSSLTIKKHIKEIYDGYIFQLYAQYYCMKEMGYEISKLELRSVDDNKKYNVKLPEEDLEMNTKFENTINEIRKFDLEGYQQTNTLKCGNCIYEDACDRSLNRGE